jgi:hypothetical protein
MDAKTKALEEMSRAQSNHRRKYGEPDPLLQRRIDLLMKKAQAPKKKKKGTNKSKLQSKNIG